MSNFLKHKFLAATVCILTGLSIGGLGCLFWQTASRQPASVLPAPKLRLKPWADSLSGKMNQTMTVVITPLGGIPETDNQELRLQASVTLNQPIDGEVQFHWTLPPSASVVSGEIEDSWTGLKNGQTATTEISLLNVSKEGLIKSVLLSVGANSAGKRWGAVGAFSTDPSEQTSEIADSVQEGDTPEINTELVLNKKRLTEKMEQTHQ